MFVSIDAGKTFDEIKIPKKWGENAGEGEE